MPTPVEVQGGHVFVAIDLGHSHGCALKESGAPYCWGLNSLSILGTGTTGNKNVPEAVVGGHSFVAISVGYMHQCALTKAGDAYCWGFNGNGQVGQGSSGGAVTSPTIVTGGLKFTSVSAGDLHSCGVTPDGDAYCWGSDRYGQLGNGDETEDKASPSLVSGGLKFATVSAGIRHSCGVTLAGDAYCWGSGENGRLGNGSTSGSNAPVPVLGGLMFVSITAGYHHTCGLAVDGKVYCWGLGDNGRLGNDGTASKSTPSLVVNVTNFAWMEAPAGTAGSAATYPARTSFALHTAAKTRGAGVSA